MSDSKGQACDVICVSVCLNSYIPGSKTFMPGQNQETNPGCSLWVSCCMTINAHIEVLCCDLAFAAQWNPFDFFSFLGLKGSGWCTRQAWYSLAVFWKWEARDVPHGLWEQSRAARGACHLSAVRTCSERALEGFRHQGSFQPEERVSAGEWALCLDYTTVFLTCGRISFKNCKSTGKV